MEYENDPKQLPNTSEGLADYIKKRLCSASDIDLTTVDDFNGQHILK